MFKFVRIQAPRAIGRINVHIAAENLVYNGHIFWSTRILTILSPNIKVSSRARRIAKVGLVVPGIFVWVRTSWQAGAIGIFELIDRSASNARGALC